MCAVPLLEAFLHFAKSFINSYCSENSLTASIVGVFFEIVVSVSVGFWFY